MRPKRLNHTYSEVSKLVIETPYRNSTFRSCTISLELCRLFEDRKGPLEQQRRNEFFSRKATICSEYTVT